MAGVLMAPSSVPEAFDESELLECIRRLVEIDQDWAFLSQSPSHLYIRPTFISTEVETPPFRFLDVSADPSCSLLPRHRRQLWG